MVPEAQAASHTETQESERGGGGTMAECIGRGIYRQVWRESLTD